MESGLLRKGKHDFQKCASKLRTVMHALAQLDCAGRSCAEGGRVTGMHFQKRQARKGAPGHFFPGGCVVGDGLFAQKCAGSPAGFACDLQELAILWEKLAHENLGVCVLAQCAAPFPPI